MLSIFRKIGWLIPFPAGRRMAIRALLSTVKFRRGAGALQLSYIPLFPMFLAMRFTATAILGVGSIHPEVIAVGGQPSVRPVVWASLAINHRVWDGLAASRFFNEFVRVLEAVDPEL